MPNTNGHGGKRAALYIRVSTDAQAEKGQSIPEQRRQLDADVVVRGYEVVEVLIDDGYTGTAPKRPGYLRMLELAEAGAIDVVLATKRDRFWRDALERKLMDRHLKSLGVEAVSLQDIEGGGVGGKIGNSILDEFAEHEVEVIRERTVRGKLQKARMGKLIAGQTPNYGFKYNATRDGYEVDEDKMAVVRRIFRMVGADGTLLYGVKRALEVGGVPAPKGGRDWSRPFIKTLIINDVYKLHTHDELSALVEEGYLEPGVLASLDPAKLYGVWWYRMRLDSDGPPERVAVPVVDAGIPRDVVEAARSAIKYNQRQQNKDHRVYELRGGVLRCGHCGRNMHGRMSPPDKRGSRREPYFYYVCPAKKVEHGACANVSHPAAALEARIAAYVADILRDPAPLLRGIHERIEDERRKLRNPDESVKDLERMAAELDTERKGYQRQNAKGLMEDEELADELVRLKDERGAVEAALAKARDRRGQIEALERDAALVLYLWAAGAVADLDKLPSEERRDLYRRMRLEVVIGTDKTPEISADLSGGPGLLPTAEGACDHVKTLVRFGRDRPEEWLKRTGDTLIGYEGADVYTVPEGVMRAYDELVAAREGGRALCQKESGS